MTLTDVIVVGAGIAGAAAARQLARAGRRVTVIEARPRCGGRGYLKPFAGDGPALEFGGAWITPWHHRLRALVAEHGLSLRPRHEVTNRLWPGNGQPGARAPTPHERAIARVAADAMLLKMGHAENEKGEALRGITFRDYLDRLHCPEATRALFSAWWTVSGNGDHAVVAASEFLHSCSYDNGLAEGMINVWSDTVVPGMGVLAERMIEASGAELLLDAPISEVVQRGDGVAITTGRGNFKAKAAVLALGINQMKPIRFSPELGEAKREAIALGHGGKSFKLWIKAEGVPVGTLVTGDGTGIEFAFAERSGENGSTMIVAFGLMQEANAPGDPSWVRGQVAKLLPNARVISSDWHDWTQDPFARGTWVAAVAGREHLFDHGTWRPEGRLAFASSDYAREQAGWFEGAVIAGEDAADAVLAFS